MHTVIRAILFWFHNDTFIEKPWNIPTIFNIFSRIFYIFLFNCTNVKLTIYCNAKCWFWGNKQFSYLNWIFFVAEKIDLLSNCQTNNNNSFCFSYLLTIIIEQLNGLNCTTCSIKIFTQSLIIARKYHKLWVTSIWYLKFMNTGNCRFVINDSTLWVHNI